MRRCFSLIDLIQVQFRVRGPKWCEHVVFLGQPVYFEPNIVSAGFIAYPNPLLAGRPQPHPPALSNSATNDVAATGHFSSSPFAGKGLPLFFISIAPFARATMANDELLTDDYVAGLLAQEAKDCSLKYSALGMEAFHTDKK